MNFFHCTPVYRLDSPEQFMGKRSDSSLGDLLQGTLDVLVLKALARGPKHGYGVAEFIHQSSHDVLRVEEGALYPALHRLELRGLLAAEWGMSENNRRAKFYTLTTAGRHHLSAETDSFVRLAGAVTQVLRTA